MEMTFVTFHIYGRSLGNTGNLSLSGLLTREVLCLVASIWDFLSISQARGCRDFMLWGPLCVFVSVLWVRFLRSFRPFGWASGVTDVSRVRILGRVRAFLGVLSLILLNLPQELLG